MNGVHDLGGMQGFGPVEREANEAVFHADWEKSVLAMNVVALSRRLYNVDEFRHGIERMGAARYLASGYYEHWLASIETLLIEKGLVARADLDARTADLRGAGAARPPGQDDPALTAQALRTLLAATAAKGEAGPAPRFRTGDRIRTRNTHPPGHTRLPRYARGRAGTIEGFHGVFTLPDAHAHGHGRQPQPLYSVRFASGDLWGDSAEPRQGVYLDLWESYLELA
jgi:nitrile hydratase subunit beta